MEERIYLVYEILRDNCVDMNYITGAGMFIDCFSCEPALCEQTGKNVIHGYFGTMDSAEFDFMHDQLSSMTMIYTVIDLQSLNVCYEMSYDVSKKTYRYSDSDVCYPQASELFHEKLDALIERAEIAQSIGDQNANQSNVRRI